jgi:uncharacterized protein YndB with AHSA1/START domain
MTVAPVVHDTFVLERHYAASPARVFRAFADPDIKARWFGCDDTWVVSEHTCDFRVGGREVWRVGEPGGVEHRNDTVYMDIVPDARLVWSYVMSLDGRRISASLATVELIPDGTGTRLVFTEHGAFLDGYAGGDERQRGTVDLLSALESYLVTTAEGVH